jgi:lipopolysaccharide biosynthesis regulator YciM
MATNISEDHDRIRDLQKNLEQAVKRWDASEKNNHEFDTLAPVANELVNAYQELENRRTQARNALLLQCGGWAAGGLAVIVLACVVFAGWSPWLLIVVLALAVAGVLLVGGGRR